MTADENEPLVVTVTGDRRRGRRAGLVAVGLAVLVITGLAALLLVPGTAVLPDDAASTAGAAPSAVVGDCTARLVGETVTTAGGERMRALTPTASGAVAVGASDVDGTPRAWRTDASGTWVPARFAQPAGLRGAVNGIAAAPAPGGRLVAVGWAVGAPGPAVPVGAARRAAVWTSTDGAEWTLSPSALGGAGLGELTDVVVAPGGGFVATGTDWTTDPRSGDGAVLTSADGTAWRAQPVAGLGGRGPAVLNRLLVDGGGYLAVGSRSDAGIGQPAVWTSPDAVTWTPGPVLPHSGVGGGEATGVARTPGGSLVVVGGTSTVRGDAAAVWSAPDPAGLLPCAVDVPDGGLGGLGVRDGRLTAVGATSAGAAAWTLEIST